MSIRVHLVFCYSRTGFWGVGARKGKTEKEKRSMRQETDSELSVFSLRDNFVNNVFTC